MRMRRGALCDVFFCSLPVVLCAGADHRPSSQGYDRPSGGHTEAQRAHTQYSSCAACQLMPAPAESEEPNVPQRLSQHINAVL